MRRPKQKKIFGSDCVRYRFTSHGNINEVDISITEKDDGTLVVEVERTDGNVVILGVNNTPSSSNAM